MRIEKKNPPKDRTENERNKLLHFFKMTHCMARTYPEQFQFMFDPNWISAF